MLHRSSWPRSAVRDALRHRDFRLLCVGQAMSLLGEQANLVALSWLALQITGDALALGAVLAVGGIPPAILMLLGGVTTDRYHPRTMMLVTDGLRLILTSILIALALVGSVTLPMLYVFALAFGLLTAFAMPAAGSIVPSLVPGAALQTANSIVLGLAQLAAFVGPALGGILIASVAPTAWGAGPGLVLAFAVYAAGLLGSVVALWRMRPPEQAPGKSPVYAIRVLTSIRGGFTYAWSDPLLRLLLIAILAANLLLTGPLTVGIPVLSRLRLPQGAAALGLIASGWGGGNLLGALLAGAIRRSKGLGPLLALLFVGFGVGVCALSWIRSMWPGFLLLFLVGTGNGYLGVVLRTLLHRRTPRELLGRVMSVFFFARTALVPVSHAASGAIIDDAGLEALYLVVGALFALLAVWLALSPALRLFEFEVERTRQDAASGLSDPGV